MRRSDEDEADRLDDGDGGRRVPGSRRPRQGSARWFRSRRMDGCARRRRDVAVPDLVVRACRCAAPRPQDLGDLGAVLAHRDAGDPVSHGINVLPKYVPSTTLKNPKWQNTHVIDGDVEAAVRELKAQPGRELQVHGSGELLRWLLERDLVDELNLELHPVVVGDGLRLFPERGPTHNLTLVESRSTPSGVTLQTYRPAGRATFGSVGE